MLFYLLASVPLFSQSNAEQKAIVDEGKKLYRSEMASWFGTDIFLEKFPEKRESIGGYFSYADGVMEKCVFYSDAEMPKVMATIIFDSTYNVANAVVESDERDFTSLENELYIIRNKTVELIREDTLFKTYSHTNLNLIPLIENDDKKVFILTGPVENGVVIFGNDYLVTFNNKNEVSTKKQLHANILPTEYSEPGASGDEQQEGAVHTHLPETGDLITSTDICTLMLYEKYTGWKSYMVVSEKYICIWNCEYDTLAVIAKDAFDKIEKDQKKRHKND